MLRDDNIAPLSKERQDVGCGVREAGSHWKHFGHRTQAAQASSRRPASSQDKAVAGRYGLEPPERKGREE